MGTKTLQDFIEELRSQLKGRIERQDDPAPENQFISDAAPSDILTKEKLVQLFDLVLYQGRGESDFVKRDHLQSLAFAIRGQEQSRPNRSTCKVLAILLHVRCEIKTLKAFARWSLPGLNQSNTNTPLSDSRLPCTQEQADRAFGKSDGYPFWSGQSLFCPVIFKENEEVVCEHPCPLPFKEKPEEIGRGSYATVYKVKIAKGHFVNGAERNLEAKIFACKVLDRQDRNDGDWNFAKVVLGAREPHDNIVKTRGSLIMGGKCKLLFDLAKYSLWDYFEKYAETPTNLHDRKACLGQTIGLAGALRYLHEGFRDESKGVRCYSYHLDIKPGNILVFEDNGRDVWKIADFGISQFKVVPLNGDDDTPTRTIVNSFQAAHSDPNPSSGVYSPRPWGTYTAPEAKATTDRVDRKSDIWSFGCVMTIVLSFCDHGRDAIRKFQEARHEGKKDDWFFDYNTSDHGPSKTELRPAVGLWLDRMARNAGMRGDSEAKIISKIVGLLCSHMLRPNPKERFLARQVEDRLKTILKPLDPVTPPSSQQQHDPAAYSLHPQRPNFLRKLRLSISSPAPTGPGPLSLSLRMPESPSKVKFSPNGSHIAIQGRDIIEVSRIEDIQKDRWGSSFSAPDRSTWKDFSIGSSRLCAIPDSDYFECQMIQHLNLEQPKVNLKRLIPCPINQVFISPNDHHIAMVVTERQGSENIARLCLYNTDNILDIAENGSAQPSASGSSNFQNLLELPFRQLLRPCAKQLSPRQSFLDVKFSRDSATLMAVTNPTDCGDPTSQYHYQYTITLWDVKSGQKIHEIVHGTTDFNTMRNLLKVSGFAILDRSQVVATISTKRFRLYAIFDKDRTHKTEETSDEFLGMIDDEHSDNVFILGKRNARGIVKIFSIDTSRKIDNHSITKKALDTALRDYNWNDCTCCVVSRYGDPTNERKVLLAACIKGKDAGKLSVTNLP